MGKRKFSQGAVAIEFALVFGLFLALLYAIVSYGLAFSIVQSFTYAAEDGLRAAIAADCTGLTYSACKQQKMTPAIQKQIANTLDWLPPTIFSQAVGNDGNKVQITFDDANAICDVRIEYNNAANPIVPSLQLPVVGSIPRLPAQLIGRARLRI